MKPLYPRRSPDRIEPMLALVRELWVASPDLRLGQILANGIRQTDQWGLDPYYVDDDDLERGLRKLKDL